MKTTSRALAFASLWFDAATIDRVFAPLVADWQREWANAAPAQRSWVLTRGTWWFAATFMLMLPEGMLRAPAPEGVLRRVAIRMTVFMLVTCGMMAMLMASDAGDASASRVIWLLLLLLPSFIAFAFPFAVAFIVDVVRPHPKVSPAQRMLMAKLAMAASLFVFAFGGWVVPPMNQMVRVETRGHDVPAPAKGVRELTTAELIFDPSLAAEQEPYTGGADRATRIRAEIQNRAYVILLPLLLVWLRWRNLELPRSGWLPLPAGVATFATFILVMTLYFGGWRLEMELGLPKGTGVWLGTAALGVWGLLAPQRRRALLKTSDLSSQLYKAFQNSRIA